MKLTDIGVISDLMGENAFKKQFGQNFLISERLPGRIAEAGVPILDGKKVGVLEVGPGIGTLTQALAARAHRVLALEIDQTLLPILDRTLADCPNVRVVAGDAMRENLAALIKEHLADCDTLVFCANLPYYITSPLLMRLLESDLSFVRLTVMVQKEVAWRLAAPAGSEHYGALSAAVAYYGQAKKLFDVPAGCFLPRPKVDSAIVSIACYPAPPVEADRELLFRVIRGAFAQRRKTLVNSLMTAFPALGKETIAAIVTSCHLSPAVRGEALDLAAFAALARALAPFCARQ